MRIGEMKGLKIRFEKKVIPVTESGCWLWQGATDYCGYGRISVAGINATAHRISWILYNGPIAEGMCVCHICDVQPCVNPFHLFLGSHQDNMADRGKKNRSARLTGIRHGMCKLTEKEVIEIYIDQRHRAEIASDYNVTKEAITAIKSGRNWKHLNLQGA